MVSRWSPKPEAGVRFSSPLPNNTPLAQWLEQNAHNVLVTGSSPVGSTKCGCSIMVLLQISNLKIGVRFPSPAPKTS